MASPVRRPGEKPSSPKFFKIILDPRAHKLKLPRDFTARYGLVLPDRVFLRAPNGPAFQVELISSDGETWLQKGWHEFVEYYSIEFGYLVLFKYDRISDFRVCIFDRTALEIKPYPFDDNHDEKLGSGSRLDDSVEGTKICERRILYTTLDDSEECIDKETSVAYQMAKAFKSDNPIKGPCFISLMQPSYISRSTMSIPLSIVKENLPDRENDIKLRSCDGTMFDAKCAVSAPNARLSDLKRFIEDSELKVGDACLFELSKLKKCIWNVYIFRR